MRPRRTACPHISHAPTSAGTVGYAAPTLTWTGALAVSATATISYSVTVRNPDPGDKALATTVIAPAPGSSCPADAETPGCTATLSFLAALGVTLAVTLTALWSAAPVLAAEAAPAIGGRTATAGLAAIAPQLSIAVDNGRTTAAAGDKLTYTIAVHNLGTADIADLHVSQSMPTGLKFTSADSAGKGESRRHQLETRPEGSG